MPSPSLPGPLRHVQGPHHAVPAFALDRRISALLVVLVLGPGAQAVPSSDPDAARSCLRCHAMETLAERDPQSGAIRDLHVAPRIYRDSVHGVLDCTDCHRRGFRRYPHRGSAAAEDLSCVACHVESTPAKSDLFRTIDGEFQASVHGPTAARSKVTGGARATPMDCHSCHDPHRFRLAQEGDDLGSIIGGHNGACLSCHGELRDQPRASHAWLPHREAHWRSVRCIECHTAREDHQSHRVLAGEASNRECVGCHSQTPRLLGQLYAYRSAQEAAASGWVEYALHNPAYVVGMSRHPALDRLALGALILTLVAVAAHALGRWRLRRRAETRP